jgi:pimeloyl-ACP methyl ester carboxylesterase
MELSTRKIVGIILLIFLIPAGIHMLTKTNSIDEYKKIRVNESDQQIWIKSNNTSNPLLLFLHGGPGDPHMHQAGAETNLLDNHFIVVQWDQRLAGASYREGADPSTLTIDQMEKDTVEVIRYLLRQFNQKKLYLVGHSWGSYLGAKVAYKYPELLHAFVGVGLVTDMIPAFKEMHRRIIRESSKKIEQLKGSDKDKLIKSREKLKKFDIESIKKNKDWNQFLESYFKPRTELGFPYTLKEIKGSNPHISTKEEIKAYEEKNKKGAELATDLFFEVLSRKLTEEVPELKIPIFAILGRHDYNVDPYLAEKYMNNLKAPCKKTIWFENSAHMMTFEEPERFKKIMINQVLDAQGCKVNNH